jgi:hypothetical protein
VSLCEDATQHINAWFIKSLDVEQYNPQLANKKETKNWLYMKIFGHSPTNTHGEIDNFINSKYVKGKAKSKNIDLIETETKAVIKPKLGTQMYLEDIQETARAKKEKKQHEFVASLSPLQLAIAEIYWFSCEITCAKYNTNLCLARSQMGGYCEQEKKKTHAEIAEILKARFNPMYRQKVSYHIKRINERYNAFFGVL